MIEIIFVIAVVSAAVGPAIRWFYRNKPDSEQLADCKDASGVLLWTLFALMLAMYFNFNRGQLLRDACNSFDEEVKLLRLSDDRWEQITSGKWYSVCHSEDVSDDE